MGRTCEGRIAVVTGAGRGLGRAHAHALAAAGATVVVNDVGSGMDGTGSSDDPAGEVVAAIRAAGGRAHANGDDVADWEGARRLVDGTVERFGRLDVLVNNAGILRDRMLVNMSADEWDAVVRVHLRGTFAPCRWGLAHWRARAKAGEDVHARVVNTTSASGLFGNVGQANYSAAKAGIAAFTLVLADEAARYGVVANAVAPAARTRMTEDLGLDSGAGGDDPYAPERVSPLVVWLAGLAPREVTGRVFLAGGPHGVALAEGWQRGPAVDTGAAPSVDDIGRLVPGLLERSRPRERIA
jgi:NAD(P)-dependent dehydrogenase (short-subunit alcohol dehydrogenase family)